MSSSSIRCIYCLDEAKPGNEHTISRLLFDPGPNTFTLPVVCDECNGFFGRTLENDLRRDSVEGVLASLYDVKKTDEFIVYKNRYVMNNQINCNSVPLSKSLPRIGRNGIKKAFLKSQLIIEKDSGNMHYFWLDRLSSPGKKKRFKSVIDHGGNLYAVLTSAQDLKILDSLTCELGLDQIPPSQIFIQDGPLFFEFDITMRLDRAFKRIMAKNAYNIFARSLLYLGDLTLLYRDKYQSVRDFILFDKGDIGFDAKSYCLEHSETGPLEEFSPTHSVQWVIEKNSVLANLQFFNQILYTIDLGPAPCLQFAQPNQVGFGYIVEIFDSGEPPHVPVKLGPSSTSINPYYFDMNETNMSLESLKDVNP